MRDTRVVVARFPDRATDKTGTGVEILFEKSQRLCIHEDGPRAQRERLTIGPIEIPIRLGAKAISERFRYRLRSFQSEPAP